MVLTMILGLAVSSSWGNYVSHTTPILSADHAGADAHLHKHLLDDVSKASTEQLHEHNPFDHTHEILFTLPEFSLFFLLIVALGKTLLLIIPIRLFPSRLERPPMSILTV